jgi:3-oxoadipate enol-lactonase
VPVHTADDGCRLAYAVSGPPDATALVLSNSLGTTRDLWQAQIDAFADHFRVVTYDTRGHGESDAPVGDYTIARLGQDVVSLLDALGIRRAHVCGISIGGLTALWLGIHAAERVDRLVLANTAACIGSRELWTQRIAMATSVGLSTLADQSMARWFTEGFRFAEPSRVQAARAAFERTAVNGYAGCCAALRDADLREGASRVMAPTLVVTGTHDPSTPPADGRWLAQAIPGSQLIEFDAAHLSNVECAAAFTTAVDEFLRA